MAELKQELIVFWRKLSRLLSAGVPTLRALRVIEEEARNPDLRAIVAALGKAIEGGKTFYEATAQEVAFFPLSVRTLIRTGELNGRVVESMAEIAMGIEEGSLPCGTLAESTVASGDADAAAVEPKNSAGAQVNAEDVSVIPCVNRIICHAISARASDLHFEMVEGENLHLRMRVDGVLHELAPPPSHLSRAIINRIKIMANLNVAETQLPQDGRMLITIQGQEQDLRVATVPGMWGENVCVRLLARSQGLVLLDNQDFTAAQLAQMRSWLKRRSGLILLAGPSGCGKTTTLYSMLQELNRPEVKILTLEDPIEYAINGLQQLPLSPHRGLTFAAALRAALRQAPDIMMVGEIRDNETAQLIVQAVLTGHLVLSSLHTQDACAAVTRLLDLGVKPFLLNAALTGVCAQRLVRRICPACRQAAAPKPWMHDVLAAHPDLKLFEGRGCDQCQQRGYRGRIAIHELLEMDDNLRRLVSRNHDSVAFRNQARRQGLLTLPEDGFAKINAGVTTLEDVMLACAGL